MEERTASTGYLIFLTMGMMESAAEPADSGSIWEAFLSLPGTMVLS